MRLVVGLRPAADTIDKPDLPRWAEPRLQSHGWVALGGLLDGRPVSYTPGPGGELLAGPETSRRHIRHASRRAEGLGLRLVSGCAGRPVSDT